MENLFILKNKKTMKITNISIQLLVIILLLFSSCNKSNSGSDYRSPEVTYQEQKVSIEDTERANPLNFLTLNYQARNNFFGKFIIEGHISNKASVAVYKDVVIQIDFYTKTNTYIDSKVYTIYEYIKPYGKASFKFKMSTPGNFQIYNVKITKASVS